MTITPDMLRHTWTKTEYYLDVCRATNSTHNRLLMYAIIL
jgi:hypothetical protein